VLPVFSDVLAAAERIAGHAHRTPVLRSAAIDELCGARFHFKCENLQRIGAFKFRGAYNALSRLDARCVVAFSSGNHAQAVALCARLLGMQATIVMPSDAPAAKVRATRGYGAEIVTYDRFAEDREAVSRRVAAERDAPIIPPFDHPHIIAGAGTATLELLDEVGELDYLFVPVGGGGLISGAALAVRARSPRTKLYGVEPATGNDAQQSLAAGAIVTIPTPTTIADGAQTRHIGELTFPIMQRDVDGIVTATDAQLIDAMTLFAERMKLVVEPTGCLGLAGARHGGVPIQGAKVGVILSGGNVDLARMAQLLG
jgi:threo-3-hydroxy-L-aspartate ammonia-lyase